MTCKNCGAELSEEKEDCPLCGAHNGRANKVSAPVKTALNSFLDAAKKKTGARSLLSDTESFSQEEKTLIGKHFLVLICSFLIMVLWFLKTWTLSLPDIDLLEEIGVSLSSLNFSLNDLAQSFLMTESFLAQFVDVLEIPPELLTILKTIGILHIITTVLVCIAPLFSLVPILHGSVSKKLWVKVSRLCIRTAFGFYLLIFLALKLIIMAMKTEIETNVSLGLRFSGFLLVLLFVIALMAIRSIRLQIKEDEVIKRRQMQKGVEE